MTRDSEHRNKHDSCLGIERRNLKMGGLGRGMSKVFFSPTSFAFNVLATQIFTVLHQSPVLKFIANLITKLCSFRLCEIILSRSISLLTSSVPSSFSIKKREDVFTLLCGIENPQLTKTELYKLDPKLAKSSVIKGKNNRWFVALKWIKVPVSSLRIC